MIKYSIIIWGILVSFVTGQQQQVQNDPNYQSGPTYSPSIVEHQFREARSSNTAPNVFGEEMPKIPCPILAHRRFNSPNIPSDQQWITVNQMNSVPPASRRFHTEDASSWGFNVENPISRSNSEVLGSRKSNNEYPDSKFISNDPISRRSNIENQISRSFNAEDPTSRRSNVENLISRKYNSLDSASRKFNAEISESRRTNVENPISRGSNSEDSATRKSNNENPESRRFITGDPISRRSNTNAPISLTSNAEDSTSRRSNLGNPISRSSNAEDAASWKSIADDPTSRRANVENPISLKSNLEDSASRKSNEEIPKSTKFIADDPLSRRSNTNDPISLTSNAEDPISRRSNLGNPISRSSNAEDPALWRSIAGDPTSRRSNVENPISRKSNLEDSASRKSNKEIPESTKFIADDTISRRSNAEDPILRRFNAEDRASWRSIENDPLSRRSNTNDHIARTFNAGDPISRRSNLKDSASRKTNEDIPELIKFVADDLLSRKSNAKNPISRSSIAEDKTLRRLYAEVPVLLKTDAEVPNSRSQSEPFPTSRIYPWQPIDTVEQTPDDAENQPIMSDIRRAQPYNNNLQEQLRRNNFYGPLFSMQPSFNAWEVLSTNSASSLYVQDDVLNTPSSTDRVQQPQIGVYSYPVEITSPNPINPKSPSDCNIKTKISDDIEPLSESRRNEDSSRRIVPGSFSPNQNLPQNNQRITSTTPNELNPNSKKVADKNIESIEEKAAPQDTNDEEKPEDHPMSIADIEQQLMEPAKGAGIITMTDAHIAVMDSSRVCYACSSITDPTCWSPERTTTVKYCARGRDSCVTKTYRGKGSLVAIRDCSSACDEALPVLGKKYESCSICGDDLCNNLYVDANGASSIFARNAISIMILSWLFKHYILYSSSA